MLPEIGKTKGVGGINGSHFNRARLIMFTPPQQH